MSKYKYHIFVCETQRDESDPRGCCAAKGSKTIRALLKRRIKELKLKGEVRVNAAGCLDTCSLGPSIVIYPQGVWYGGVTINDVEDIIQEHILNGEIVERLLQEKIKKNE